MTPHAHPLAAPRFPGMRPPFMRIIVVERDEPDEAAAAPAVGSPLPAPSAPPRMPARALVPCVPLLPGRGLRRVVRLGDFREMLAPQISEPGRLQENHRLPCYLQIFEATATEPLAQLARRLLGAAAHPGQVRLLRRELEESLELGAHLPPRRPPTGAVRRSGFVLPGDRLLHLRVAHDPTVEGATEPQAVRPPEAPSPAAAAPPSPLTVPPQPAGRRTTIPERFTNPWEFRLSREEVLYDIAAAATSQGPLRRLLRRIADRFTAPGELRRWRLLLQGRTADEQLWAVRPPPMALRQPALRAWIAHLLALNGYDAQVMLPEWEIFWRRRGL